MKDRKLSLEQFERRELLTSTPWGDGAVQVLPVGDWDTDGYDDVAVTLNGQSQLRVYLGGDDGLASDRFEEFEFSVRGIEISRTFDAHKILESKDGFSELLGGIAVFVSWNEVPEPDLPNVGDPVFLWSPDGIESFDVIHAPPAGVTHTITPIGHYDLNGDGIRDHVAVDSYRLGVSTTAPWGAEAKKIVPVGDWNLDGVDDLGVVTANNDIRVYFGSENGFTDKLFL